jgi:hypothetical protein
VILSLFREFKADFTVEGLKSALNPWDWAKFLTKNQSILHHFQINNRFPSHFSWPRTIQSSEKEG